MKRRAVYPPLIGVTILSLSMLLGWVFRIDWLVQWCGDFVPIQFNTVLCFLGLSLALWAYVLKRTDFTYLFAGLTLLLSWLTGLQYLTNANFGIDQVFWTSHIQDLTYPPDRMAPNTALSFVIASLSIMALPIWPKVSGVLSVIPMALGMLSLTGYITQVDVLYHWGPITAMAASTALLFTINDSVTLYLATVGVGERLSQFTLRILIPLTAGLTAGVLNKIGVLS